MNAEQSSPLALFARTQGSGTPVVCLHSSTGSHAQWRGLVEALTGHCRSIAVDLHGHGRSPVWPAGQANSLQVDAHGVSALMQAAIEGGAPGGMHLVGHSYGAAVALQIALCYPRWVRSLTLYEPVAFGVIRSMAPADDALGEIEDIAHSVETMVRAGELEGAARIFVGYWGGACAWEAMGPSQRAAVLGRIATVPRHFEALFRATWGPRLLSGLTMPTLLLQGTNTRAPARRVAELLGEALPHLHRIELAGAGHLGPMTHEPDVTALIVEHLGSSGLAQPAHRGQPAFA